MNIFDLIDWPSFWFWLIVAYCVGVFGLIRFFQAVHRWDDEIEKMEKDEGRRPK